MTVTKKTIFIMSVILITLLSISSLCAQTSGFHDPIVGNLPRGKQWAVFIAIGKYSDLRWNSLPAAVQDAEGIKNILLDYYQIDEVRRLYDEEATYAGINRLFVELRDEVSPYDSVFIYHVGHGINNTETNATAWIPYDGIKDTLAQQNWFHHFRVRSLVNSLNVQHVFLVSDSCYSGDLLDGKKGEVVDLPANYSIKSRLVMTSGVSETVSAGSEFADRFKNVLLYEPVDILTPNRIYDRIINMQTTSRLTSSPGFGPLPNSTNHEIGGSFFFFRKQSAALIEGSVYEDFEFVIVDGGVTITKYTGNAETVMIPARIPDIQGFPVTAIGESAFGDCDSLVSIIIPSTVTSIGNSAFLNCSSLISIAMPPSVTSIGYWAFENCSSLTNISIPPSVTSIGWSAFPNCSSLTNIIVDRQNPYYASIDGVLFDKNIQTIVRYPEGRKAETYAIPSSVTSIDGAAFFNCGSLATITIPSSVRSVGDWTFQNCDSLARINIPSSVTYIGNGAFAGCSSLTSIAIPSSVTFIGGWMFEYCGSLASITIPSTVTYIGEYTFVGCVSLASIAIPSSVTSIGDGAFSGCSSLTSITIPSSVTYMYIGDGAFSGCYSLVSIAIPSSVTYIGDGAFNDCSSLSSITVDSHNPAYSSIEGVLFDKDVQTLITYPEGKTARTYTIPSSVTFIRNSAFSNCGGLVNIVIPSSVTSIDGAAFFNCYNLASITIPSSVTYIGDGAFNYCVSLASITIPSSVTSIGGGAFYDCISLTSITIPSSVTYIVEEAFYDCGSLTSITIPSSVTYIDSWAFSGCNSLSGISVDVRNPSYASIEGVLFDKDIQTLIKYPEGKTARTYTIPSSVTSIGGGAFYDCINLTSITIPSSVAYINDWAFYDCSSLTSVSLSWRTWVGYNAFPDSTRIIYRD